MSKRLLISILVLLSNLCSISTIYAQQRTTTSRISLIQKACEHYGFQLYFKEDILLEEEFEYDNQPRGLSDVLKIALVSTPYSYLNYRNYAIAILPISIVDNELNSNINESEDGFTMSNGQNLEIVGSAQDTSSDDKVKLRGRILDELSHESVVGATIYIVQDKVGTISDENGKFELDITTGIKELEVEYLGFAKITKFVDVRSSGGIVFQLSRMINLDEVTISAISADRNIENIHIGAEFLDLKQLKRKPTILGEVDLVKGFLLEPGVNSISDGAPGINVRGGNVDQNLIQQDDGLIFNSSHALGFFSVFNSDLLSSATLYKSTMPAQFGGRLASVMDVRMKDGNFEEAEINGSLGLITSRLNMSFPIVKDKLSVIAGGRISYVNWLLKGVNNIEVKNSTVDFKDFNGRITFKINPDHIFSVSGFASDDGFLFNQEFGFEYSTEFVEVAYRSIYNDKWFNRLSFVGHRYNSSRLEFAEFNSFDLQHGIDYLRLKNNLRYVPNDRTEINIGASAIEYTLEPNTVVPLDSTSLVVPVTLGEEKAREIAVYAEYTLDVTDNLEVSGGLRYSNYSHIGPGLEYQYTNPETPQVNNIQEIIEREGTLFSEAVFEPRVFVKYKLEESSVKFGYSRTSQFINQLFNADSPVPTSQWQVSTKYIAPQKSHNFSLGYFRNWDNNIWEMGGEVYYRNIDQVFDYRDFAQLVSNDHIETELLFGIGRSYGVEYQIKKNIGEVTGWLSYSYSRTQNKINGINRGEWYATSYDISHSVSSNINIAFSERKNLTINSQFNVGRPTTPPVGTVTTSNGNILSLFDQRNIVRIPPTIRLDLSYTLTGSERIDKKFKTSWVFSIYNILGRNNPYSVFYEKAQFQQVVTKQISLLGYALPSVSIKFNLK